MKRAKYMYSFVDRWCVLFMIHLFLVCAIPFSLVAQWYPSTTVYQIYPRSFKDSDGDGIGDLQGIISQLDYIQSLGYESIWISPYTLSPQADFGYDISDFVSIAPEYGTMQDVELLIHSVHDRGMKLIFDMVLNHTSDQHAWFQESRKSKDNPKSDWYVWRKGRGKNGKKPPTNWKAMIGGSGWKYAESRGEWYWSSFLPFQPDLNYRNPEVKEAMFSTVRFWLDKGVDGFRLDIFNALYEDAEFRNNPFAFRAIASDDNPNGFFQNVKYTLNQSESFEIAHELRAILDEYGEGQKMSIGEVFGPPETLRKYCGENGEGLHSVFFFKTLSGKFKVGNYRNLIEEFETHFPAPFTPVWVFSNHDRIRSFSRYGEDLAKSKLLAVMQMTVRGIPYTYAGEEIGMSEGDTPLKQGLDPVAQKYSGIPQWVANMATEDLNRDNCRTPMQWDASPNAGFTTGTPWLQVNDDFKEVNVEAELGKPEALLEHYRSLLALRKSMPALNQGTMELLNLKGNSSKVLTYTRVHGTQKLFIALNFSKSSKTIVLPEGVAPVALFPASLSQQAGETTLSGYGFAVFIHN